MRIAIVNPPDRNTVIEFPDEQGNGFLEADDYGRFPPLGALYVLSYLEKHLPGHELFFFDCPSEQMSHDELRKRLADLRPDVVGLTSFTVSLVDVVLAARSAKEANPRVHVCMGGHHAIAYPREAIGLPDIDSIVVGDGEVAFTQMIGSLERGEDVGKIPGVYTKESIAVAQRFSGDKRFLHHTAVKPAYLEEIDSLPFPNRRHIRHIDYQSIVGVSRKLTTILSSRGCPYKCTFCNVPFKDYRERTPANIVDEIEECLDLGYEEFHFYDDLFNLNPRKVISFCDELDRRRVKTTWDFRGRVHSITAESLERAKNSGCRMISFGVETGTNEGLRVLRKGTNVKMVKNAFDLCKQAGIVTIADYMIGLPHEKTPEDVMANVDYVIDELEPDFAQFNVLTLYPHTEIYDQAVAKGIIEPGRWHEFARNPAKGFRVDHWEEHMPISELVKLHAAAYRKFYFRPRYVWKSLMGIRTPHELLARVQGVRKILPVQSRPNIRF
jgi:radical SAM superfamily enzyme YgiQ (UPF0313 family)